MDPDSRPLPSVTVADAAWRRFVPDAERHAARAAALSGRQVSVVLTSDRAVRALNARDRGRVKPTNVLTYEPPAQGLPAELFLALGTVRREARARRITGAAHLAHLVLHGALHADGHTHDSAGQARRMEMEEARLLARIGVKNPWKRPG